MSGKAPQSGRHGLVLGIDGGQSSTLALIATLEGRILGAGLAGASNHITEPGGLDRLENSLRQSMSVALQNAGRSVGEIVSVCLGMTGGIDQARAIMTRLVPSGVVQSHEDMVTALAGASAGQPGVVVISGTGAVAYGRDAQGREFKAGGWGYIMGDEGSGYAIGRAALSAATRALDGSGSPTLLQQRIPAHFAMESLYQLHKSIYASEITRPQIASLASVVADAARAGDSAAREILDIAGRLLAAGALAVIRRLETIETGMAVYTTGGVFRAEALILGPFSEAIQAVSPRSTVQPAAFSPAIGALFLALTAAATPLTDHVIGNIQATLPQSAVTKNQPPGD